VRRRSPKAKNQQSAAAKVLVTVTVLDSLRKGSARGHRGGLAVVRAMSAEKGGA
jgi:hypothetical protein